MSECKHHWIGNICANCGVAHHIAQESELTRLRAENEELRKALRPFTKRYSVYEKGCRDAGEESLEHGRFHVDIADCRRAAELLNRKETK